MAGRPDFSTPGTMGSGQTIAVSNRPELRTVDATQTGTLASGETEVTEVYAPTGSIYDSFNIFVRVDNPSSAASGNHYVYVETSGNVRSLFGKSDYATWVRFQHSAWMDANLEVWPTDEAAAMLAVGALKASENQPVRFSYNNQTDVEQPNDRIYKIAVEEQQY